MNNKEHLEKMKKYDKKRCYSDTSFSYRQAKALEIIAEDMEIIKEILIIIRGLLEQKYTIKPKVEPVSLVDVWEEKKRDDENAQKNKTKANK